MRYNINAGYGQTILSNVPLGAGKVFWVAPANTTLYDQMSSAIQSDPDGVQRLFSDIQSALDATVANRDDYVLVMASNSDYDLTAALTMSKNRVHLICPQGLGWGGLPGNTARIHQTTATTNMITVTADNVEIAGFFFKGYDGTAHDTPAIIELSGTRWCSHIHDNFFGIGSTASSNNYGIYAAGACSHFSIHDNYLTNYAPGLITGTNNDMAAFIAITSASSTRGIIKNNIMHTGANTTVAVGINNNTAYGITVGNIMVQDVATGAGADAGSITAGINLAASGMASNNHILGGVAGSAAFTGGTADASCVNNYVALNGGTLVDIDT